MGTSSGARRSGQCGGVVPAARCEFGRHNEPLGIYSDVQLPPIPAFLRCLVLVRVPFAATQNLEPCGINDQVRSGRRGLGVRGGTTTIWFRRERVVWSGALRLRPIKRSSESRNPSVWRSGRLKTTRSVNAVRIARFEYRRCPPRRPFFGGIHAAIAILAQPDRDVAAAPEATLVLPPVPDSVLRLVLAVDSARLLCDHDVTPPIFMMNWTPPPPLACSLTPIHAQRRGLENRRSSPGTPCRPTPCAACSSERMFTRSGKSILARDFRGV